MTRTPKLYRRALARLGNRAEAEDAVQSVLANVWRRWDSAVASGDPDAYVGVALERYCTSWWRRLLRRRCTHRPVEDSLDERADMPDPHARDHAEDHANRALLEECMKRLSQRQREVLVLRYDIGMADEEIARHLGVAPATVRKHASDGLARMRTLLGPASAPSGGRQAGQEECHG